MKILLFICAQVQLYRLTLPIFLSTTIDMKLLYLLAMVRLDILADDSFLPYMS